MSALRWCLSTCLTFAVVGGLAAHADGQVINFEEFEAENANSGYLTEEYAALGIHFFTTDDGSTWDGLSNGDPGNWGLEGTNGPTFLGFNGTSYGLSATFDTPVDVFSLDVSRSNGSVDGVFTMTGLLNSKVVEVVNVKLGPINNWSTLQFTEVIDEMVWSGTGEGFHPYGVDNLHWTIVPGPSTLALILLGALGLRRRRHDIP